MQALSIGFQLQDGKYTIEKVLGQGGFGITYLAKHEYLNVHIAIKEFFLKQYCDREESSSLVRTGLPSNSAEVEHYKEKFLKEARLIAKLHHPNIVKVHDIFKENNTIYYVMDYIEGKNLNDLANQQGPIPEKEAIEYIHQAGAALQYIHEHKLNHLDVKPANLMLQERDHRIILIDFGMSKQYDVVSGNQTSTTPVGRSNGYAPIEQYREGGIKEFSPQTDIYALGATLYKLVTGQTPPYAGEIIDDGLPEMPAHLSTQLKTAIEKAMDCSKKNRPESVSVFLAMLPEDSPRVFISENPKSFEETEDETKLIAETEGTQNGHDWVDLGLPSHTKWASCNLGTYRPECNGLKYAWGEKSSKSSFTAMNYDDSVVSDPAKALWGPGWKIPTKENFEELIKYCQWKWTGAGYLVSGKVCNASIFLPAAGWQYGDSIKQGHECGEYWCSNANGSKTAWKFHMDSNNRRIESSCSYYGLSVRPIID